MIAPLEGFSVIEGSAFVAAPSGGMTLAQLGADVIRFDNIGGGLDYKRWPLTEQGESLYWAGLNKGKRSIAVNLRDLRAQEILAALITTTGTFLTNFPTRGWMSYKALSEIRPDLVMLAITGNRDGSTALDYTVNSAIGYPYATGPIDDDKPINHVLPAWDLVCGQTAALGLLAADRHRLRTGEGSSMTLALSDVALAAVSALGHISEAQINGTQRERYGNDLYGAFGAEFVTADDRRLYAVGISPKQWKVLQEATESTEAVAAIASRDGFNFRDEGHRFAARADIKAVMQNWIGQHSLTETAAVFDNLGVCWGPYQTFEELVANDPRASVKSTLFRNIEQPNIGTYLTPGSPVAFNADIPVEPTAAPALGEHTDQILSELLALSDAEIGHLHDDGVVAGPS
ncbi:MAG: CoA transferase [Acidimicrobiales bacterium]